MKKEFYNLVDALEFNNYEIEVYDEPFKDHIYATNTNFYDKDIYFGFCTPTQNCYEKLNGKISAFIGDYKEWENSIITLKIPVSFSQIQFIISMFNKIKNGEINKTIYEYDYGIVYDLI